ncbi:MAG: 30S ribosomal protein S8e [Candidatus Aenigmarchaeota archaeon]|nr:30S ribosomal protein S8e [Candidatus Aenigmarchaeota archaeon]
MVILHTRSKRKSTGGLYKSHRKKKNYEVGREFTKTTVGEKKVHKVRGMGGNIKIALRQDTKVNVIDKGKSKVETVKKVIENKANPQFIRSGIVTKGAVVETKSGKVKITSRPGQDGALNGVVVE